MQFVQGNTYYWVELYDDADNFMTAVAVAPSSASTMIGDDNIHQVCASFLGLTSSVDGTVPGPVAKLIITKCLDDTVPIPAPA